ncbi:uncharacterized protein [Euwallacea similis]|uniref:uncharacterized protein n=1 Tax=Euwallacea similis TaxID=1736056 RepID=UPI00344C3EA9
MKVAVFILGCFISAFVSAEIEEQMEYDWFNIKPLDIEVEPIGPPISDGVLKIVGGSVASRNQFPYQAALVINNSGFCGGSIISNQWILTAAHCVDTANSVQVILGAHNPMTTTNEPTQVRLTSSSRVVHNQWNSATLANDVAVLRVSNIPVGNTGISAISLAPASSGTFAGSTATVSGWGRTSDSSNAISSELRFVQVPVITNAVCQSSYGSIVQAQHICTSGTGGRGSCNGDSGGPLVIGGVEVGVVSFGATRCQAGHPSAFARVSHFRAWIQQNTGVSIDVLAANDKGKIPVIKTSLHKLKHKKICTSEIKLKRVICGLSCMSFCELHVNADHSYTYKNFFYTMFLYYIVSLRVIKGFVESTLKVYSSFNFMEIFNFSFVKTQLLKLLRNLKLFDRSPILDLKVLEEDSETPSLYRWCNVPVNIRGCGIFAFLQEKEIQFILPIFYFFFENCQHPYKISSIFYAPAAFGIFAESTAVLSGWEEPVPPVTVLLRKTWFRPNIFAAQKLVVVVSATVTLVSIGAFPSNSTTLSSSTIGDETENEVTSTESERRVKGKRRRSTGIKRKPQVNRSQWTNNMVFMTEINTEAKLHGRIENAVEIIGGNRSLLTASFWDPYRVKWTTPTTDYLGSVRTMIIRVIYPTGYMIVIRTYRLKKDCEQAQKLGHQQRVDFHYETLNLNQMQILKKGEYVKRIKRTIRHNKCRILKSRHNRKSLSCKYHPLSVLVGKDSRPLSAWMKRAAALCRHFWKCTDKALSVPCLVFKSAPNLEDPLSFRVAHQNCALTVIMMNEEDYRSTKMKIAIFSVICLLSSFVSADLSQEFEYDWSNIKPINVYVEPIGPAPADQGLRIVGGTVATRNGYPYQVALIINNSGFCGGSIISEEWVLTAAHCVSSASSVQVIAGAHNPSTTVDEPTQVRITAESRIVHNDYSGTTLVNDIALLKGAIPIGQEGISAVNLAPSNSGNFAGTTATLTGWGRTSDSSNTIASELQTIQLPVITNAVCQNSFGSYIRDQHICTSGAGNRGACNGDSGGPLVVSGVEVGIVSFGSSSCQAGHPTVYARVSSFREWIEINSLV